MISLRKMHFKPVHWQGLGMLMLVVSAGNVFAQNQTSSNFPGAAAPQTNLGARFLEACQQNIEQGINTPACQGAAYINEINNLKEEALRTNTPELFTLVGDAYKNNGSAIADVSQAYRWYLLGAVRGDARAMQRLSELYQDGKGAPQDKIKAAGYERLARRLGGAKNPVPIISKLGSEMAVEEVALAQRFADEFEKVIQRQPLDATHKRDAAKDKRETPRVAVPIPAALDTVNIPGIGLLPPTDQKSTTPTTPVENENPGK
jgi:hypothetical protein